MIELKNELLLIIWFINSKRIFLLNLKMASLINITKHTDEQVNNIIKLLTLVPMDKEAEEKKKWKFAKKGFQTKKEVIPMFQYDYIEGNRFLRVPFRVACALNEGKLVNRDREYPKVEYKFAGNLLEHQVSIVQEAYTQMYNYGTTSLNIYTGGGKTYMSAFLLAQTQCIACVFLNLQTLIKSWENTFLAAFPDLKDRIWIVGEKYVPENPAIIICMDQRATQIPDHLRRKIGCMIIDEAHLFCTISKVPTLLYLEPKYIICNTATLNRNDGMEVMMHSIVGTHGVTRASVKPFKLFKVKTNIHIPEEMGKNGLEYSKFVNEQADCMERNLIAMNIIHGNPGHKFMIFTKTKKHVDNIATLCQHYGIEYDTLYGTKKKFEDKNVLLFSIGKTGTGFDLSAALGEAFSGVTPDTLILMTTIKAEPKMKQVLGRVLRSATPRFVYLIDRNEVTKSHFRKTKQMFLESMAEIVEVDYNPVIPGGGVVLKS